MTQTTTETTAAPDTFWRRHRATLLIVAALVLAVGVTVAVGTGGQERTGLDDPDNPGPDGAQALARVLDDEGVDVSVARSADDFDDTDIDGSTTVLVTSSDQLGTSTIERLLAHAGDSRLVLVDPGPGATEALGLTEFPSSVDLADGREAGCDDPLLQGLTLEADRAFAYDGAGGCFAEDDAAVVLERGGVTLFGAGQALTNEQILRADNAAVGLRLLGQNDDLVWYVPTYQDLVGDDGVSASSLIPEWIRPGIWLVAIAAILLIVWRSRRLGSIATEPLPVVVKAIETTRSRGRLYRKAGDRGHAAAALRAAARTRAAERLRLGPGHDEGALIRDLARHVDRPEAEVAGLVSSQAAAPASDRDLIHLASDLAALDREVRST